jgi:hypothetical protein
MEDAIKNAVAQSVIKGEGEQIGLEKKLGLVTALEEAEKIERDIVALKKEQADAAKREMEQRLAGMKTTSLTAEENNRLSRSRGTGAFQAAVDVTFGRTPTADLLAENRLQSGLLRSIDSKMGRLATGNTATDVFGFP